MTDDDILRYTIEQRERCKTLQDWIEYAEFIENNFESDGSQYEVELIEKQKVKKAIEKHICDLKFKVIKEIKLPATERHTHDHIQEFEELVKKELGLEK